MTDIDSEDEEKTIEINQDLYTSLINSFELELKKIFKAIAKKYGEDYFFNSEDLFNFYKEYTLEFRYKPQSPITKTHPPQEDEVLEEESDLKSEKNRDNDNNKCFARVWSGGYMDPDNNEYGGRCQRKRLIGLDYCRQHKDHLVHGRFDQEPSKIIKGFFIKHNDPSYLKEKN